MFGFQISIWIWFKFVQLTILTNVNVTAICCVDVNFALFECFIYQITPVPSDVMTTWSVAILEISQIRKFNDEQVLADACEFRFSKSGWHCSDRKLVYYPQVLSSIIFEGSIKSSDTIQKEQGELQWNQVGWQGISKSKMLTRDLGWSIQCGHVLQIATSTAMSRSNNQQLSLWTPYMCLHIKGIISVLQVQCLSNQSLWFDFVIRYKTNRDV